MSRRGRAVVPWIVAWCFAASAAAASEVPEASAPAPVLESGGSEGLPGGPETVPEPAGAGSARAAASPASPDGAQPIPEAHAAPERVAPGLPQKPAYSDVVETAWLAPAPSLAARVERVRRVATGLGLDSVEPAARALLAPSGPGSRVERARAAVRLAPELPAARMALASALLSEELDPAGAAAAALAAIRALPLHLESALWLEVTGLQALSRTLLWTGLLYLVVAAAFAARRAAHDLGDLTAAGMRGRLERVELPSFAGAALLLALLLLPALLGEGAFGLALGLFGVSFVYAASRGRVAAALAVALVLVALHPVAHRTALAHAQIGADPVVPAARGAANGLPTLLDTLRLSASPADPLAREALALSAKRGGDFAEADATLASLARGSADPRLLNNAANLRFLLGESESAISLYEQAAQRLHSPVVLFNLSQAYGRAIRLGDHERVLAEAQELDAAGVEHLMTLQEAGASMVMDLPIPTRLLRQRLRSAAAPVASTLRLRDPLAPGPLAGHAPASLGAFAVLAVLAVFVSRRFRPSRWCERCGVRMCPRCDRKRGSEGLCEACTRLYHRPETTDPGMRAARLATLRQRQQRLERIQLALALLVPGASGILADSGALALLGTAFLAAAAACVAATSGAVPDPLSAGGAGSALFVAAALACFLAYAGVLVLGLRRWRRG